MAITWDSPDIPAVTPVTNGGITWEDNSIPEVSTIRPIPKSLTYQQQLHQELSDNPVLSRLAAFGSTLADMYNGGRQLVSGAVNAAGGSDGAHGIDPAITHDIQDWKTISGDHPLISAAGGAATLGTAGYLAPSLNSLRGAALAGSTMGALEPTNNPNVLEGKGQNALVGGAMGSGGVLAGRGINQYVDSLKAPLAIKQAQNATKDANTQSFLDAGFKIPRSLYNPSFLTDALESLGGKAANKQSAQISNQGNVNALARKFLNIDESTPLDQQTFDTLLHDSSQPYRDVAALPSVYKTGINSSSNVTGAQLVNALSDAKAVSRSSWQAFNSGQGSSNAREALKTARAADQDVAALESQIETLAKQNGSPQLLQSLQDARTKLAQIHSIENVTNMSDGNVNPRLLAAQKAKGKLFPANDEANLIADFGNAYKQVAVPGASIQSPGVSATNAGLATLLGTMGHYFGGDLGAAAAVIPFTRPVFRSMALSDALQKAPTYTPAWPSMLAQKLLASGNSPMALTGAALPTLSK